MTNHFPYEDIVKAIKSVLPENLPVVPLHEPNFNGNEWAYVKECLDSGWVSSVGAYVDRFEDLLIEYTGVKHAVAVVNGTAALHVCLLLAGVKPGDEVLVPTLTFVATANAVVYCGATPHFVDSAISTLGVDPTKLDEYLQETVTVNHDGCYNKVTGRPIRALVPMHTFGHPVDLDGIVEVCNKYRLLLVEDAAESLGSFYKEKHTGHHGLLSALSFNGNKVVTSGGGGAILTNNEDLGRLAKHLTTTARVAHPWELRHDLVAYNYRMPNINAALGCAQLEQLPSFITQKRILAKRYQKALVSVSGATFFTEPKSARSNYWLNTLLLDQNFVGQRDSLLEILGSNGVQARPAWTPMHRLPMFQDCPRMDLSTSENLVSRIINIPSSAVLGGDVLDA
ncbi:MAG: LegC family aminotransferase [Proteobacteria bacterium]|nr:LegC family aminotransferase [Pseudomonadota bacterium]MBU1688661.1 LegC family aminotransferase [Pseudomonadota bacterium]